MSTYTKLAEFGKSFIWFLGAAILLVQTYRVVAFYLFDQPMEIIWHRDGLIAIAGFSMMFIQNALKSAVKKIISKKTDNNKP